jgi:AcrR family transcriptional regulator
MATRGRPRSFDRDAALGKAMMVFWARGYDGTSIADLLQAMNLKPPSLYAAFGSKEQLFKEAVARYNSLEGAAAMQSLADAPTARQAIEEMLHRNVDAYADASTPSGCMVVLGATIGAPAGEGARAFLSELRRSSQDLIQHRLERGVAEGDLPEGTDTAAMAMFYTTVQQGLSIQALDGAGQAQLHKTVGYAMAVWGKGFGADTRRGWKPRPTKASLPVVGLP